MAQTMGSLASATSTASLGVQTGDGADRSSGSAAPLPAWHVFPAGRGAATVAAESCPFAVATVVTGSAVAAGSFLCFSAAAAFMPFSFVRTQTGK